MGSAEMVLKEQRTTYCDPSEAVRIKHTAYFSFETGINEISGRCIQTVGFAEQSLGMALRYGN